MAVGLQEVARQREVRVGVVALADPLDREPEDLRAQPGALGGAQDGAPLRPDDLVERGAPDLELVLGRLAGAQHPLQLVAGPAQQLRRHRVLVALRPGEHLDRDAQRRQRDRALRDRARRRRHAPQQRGAREVGGEHRRHEMRPAAVVLLRGVRRVAVGLVGGDRLVLDAVPLGDLAAAQGDDAGHDRDRGEHRLRARPPGADAAHDLAARARGGDRPDHLRVLPRQTRLRQPLLHERQHDDRLGQAQQAAHAGDAVGDPQPRLAAGADRDGSVLAPHGGGPVRRAVHEQAVAQGHPAEAQLLIRHRAAPSSHRGSRRSRTPCRARRSARRRRAAWARSPAGSCGGAGRTRTPRSRGTPPGTSASR